MKKFLTTEEVAELLRQKPRTVTAWANAYVESGGAEGIPAHRKGRRWLFIEGEVMASLDRKFTAITAGKAKYG